MEHIEGLRELEKKLDSLDTKLEKKIMRKAVKESNSIALDAAKNNALSVVGGKMGQLLSYMLSINVRIKKGIASSHVGYDKSTNDIFVDISKKGNRNYIPNAVEYGHKAKDGSKVAPMPFMRKASDSTEKTRISKFIDIVKDELQKIFK